MKAPVTRAVVDLGCIARNVRAMRHLVRKNVRIMAVVKADAYGHGDVPVAKTVLANGADSLGVARLEEGIALRQAGIPAPILVFGFVPEEDMHNLIRYQLTATVFSTETAGALSRVAIADSRRVRVHLKIDTGMGRLGLLPQCQLFTRTQESDVTGLAGEIAAIRKFPGLDIEGIYTHFATADQADKQLARHQFSLFQHLLEALCDQGIRFPVRHAANSGAMIDMPETHLDMVRPGISIYGCYPSKEVMKQRLPLCPAMALETRIVHLKQVPAGFSVSYGCAQKTTGSTVIATVPVGYADGFVRGHSCRGQMLVGGRKVPVIGRVCMDHTMLDVGHVPHVRCGDPVVVLGAQGDALLTADDHAATIGTINYEILTGISNRIPRCYMRDRTSTDVQSEDK